MTNEELDALDARCARALGYWWHSSLAWYVGEKERIGEFHPTRSWADCGLLLDELEREGYRAFSWYWPSFGLAWAARFDKDGQIAHYGDGDTPKVAIVLAACEALERGKG